MITKRARHRNDDQHHRELPELDADRDVTIVSRIRPGSGELAAVFSRAGAVPLANDTSCGAGFAPLTDLERVVLAVERRLNARETKRAHPEIGADVKVMGVRRGARVALKEQRSWATEPLAPIAALLVVVIVIGAGLFGFAISELTSDDGGGEAAQRPAAATAEESAPEAEGPAVVSGEGQGTERSAQPAPAEEPATNPNAIPGWPAGITAHTVVLVTTIDDFVRHSDVLL